MNKPQGEPKQPQFDEVLKRMLSRPPAPKQARPVKKGEKKKPAV